MAEEPSDTQEMDAQIQKFEKQDQPATRTYEFSHWSIEFTKGAALSKGFTRFSQGTLVREESYYYKNDSIAAIEVLTYFDRENSADKENRFIYYISNKSCQKKIGGKIVACPVGYDTLLRSRAEIASEVFKADKMQAKVLLTKMEEWPK